MATIEFVKIVIGCGIGILLLLVWYVSVLSFKIKSLRIDVDYLEESLKLTDIRVKINEEYVEKLYQDFSKHCTGESNSSVFKGIQ